MVCNDVTMPQGNGECPMGLLDVYISVTTTVSSLALIALIVVVGVALWKIYRRQSDIITWILDVDKEAGNGRVSFGHRGSPRVSGSTYAAVRSNSQEAFHEELPVPQSPANPEARQDRSSGGQQGDMKEDDAVKIEGAVGGVGQRVKPKLARKNKRSLSLPRDKTKRTLAKSNHQFDMKRITYELKKTEQFQRTSAGSDTPGPEAESTSPSGAFGTLERHSANRVHRNQDGDGNEYAVAVIANKPDPGCAPAHNAAKGDPFYFQLNGAAQEDGADTGAEIRDRRSMSDASFVQNAVSRFPLKMIFDKSGRASKQRQMKKVKSEDQPLPLMESTQDNEYERISREASLPGKRPRHAAVTTAESDGEYSKLKRNMTKDNGAVQAEGYDRISTEASPTSPDNKDKIKSRFSMVN